ncbi:hypothetical protein [Acinetobacter sp. WCHAc060025]|uniref:hypothetical protein n=1 Tax=Acinetobacter sp. WCHAc060025 TaxID=2518625 RepID=UPI001023D811|nr:hypothetical protein [Acinetobacter sp. WCHAc060025]RZG74732.1 hypothetical protein EXE09_12120 [Acinetobacter sp. WCHAc060025]
MIDPRIPLMGQQQADPFETATKGIQFGQGLRQLLYGRQAGNMAALNPEDRQAFANKSMFSRELNQQLKADAASQQKQMYDQLKTEAEISKIGSEAYKNNQQGGGYALENSGKKLGAIQGAFQQASLSGDKGQVLLGLNALVRTGHISPEDYKSQEAIVNVMSPEELKQYAGGINFANAKDPAALQYQSADNAANNKQSDVNNQRTTNASIYGTDVAANTADKNRAQSQNQFEQNFALNQQKQFFEQNKPIGFEVGNDGFKYAIYPNGKGVRVLGDDGQPLKVQVANNPAATAQKEETQRLQRVDAVLPEIEKLLPKATNSYVGRGLDYLVRGFGGSNQGDIATDQLKTLSGQLVSLMPKMSGPQSDKDVAMYKEMAGNLSDPTKSVEARMAALGTIRDLNEKYKELNQQNNTGVRPPTINSYSFMP